MKRHGHEDLWVLVFFLCFFFVFSSGRIASQDAGQQLQAAVLLAVSGGLGDDGHGSGPADASWVRGPNGRLYQAHDIGNIVLMLPAAWLGARLSPASATDDVLNPPALSRAGSSLACAALAALGCFWMFRLLSLYWPAPTAFLLALAFPATTFFIAYARAAWDVLGGCVLLCGALYASARLLRGEQARRSGVMLALTMAGVCSFRYPLSPFLAPAACGVFLLARRHLSRRIVIISAAVFTAAILPTFAYNFVRTGSPFWPATASDQYLHGVNALTGSVPHGLYGLFLSPNRGLFLFSPILLLVFVAAIHARELRRDQRLLLAVYGAGAAGYTLLISKMANWGAFGWGPRYLLPILPVLFFGAACGAMRLWTRARPAVLTLAMFSSVLTIPPAVVNWHLATTSFAGADQADTPSPAQQRAGWTALAWGLQGRPLPVPPNAAGDALRATTSAFPDLFLWRLADMSRAGMVLALIGASTAIGAAVFSARRILVVDVRGPRSPRGTSVPRQSHSDHLTAD
jgi:hypothetical protein